MVHNKGYTLNEYYLITGARTSLGPEEADPWWRKFGGRVLWCATDGIIMP